MLGKKITSSIIMFLLFGFSFSQVTLEIKNVNATAGTLEIHMTNPAGCSYCTDPTFDNKNGCETYGSTDGGNTQNAVWTFDATITAADCAGTCSDSSIPEETCTKTGTCSDATYSSVGEDSCEAAGTCSKVVHTTKSACETASGTWTAKTAGVWTANTWTHAAKNGNYFSGEVGGFQFELKGATTTAASGGAAATVDAVSGQSFSVTAGGTKTLGYSTNGDVIPASATSVLLTTITYTDDAADTSKGICFGKDTGSSGENAVSDKHGGYINTIWGVCSCDNGVADACGECEGNNPTNCYATDSNDVCTLDNQCEADYCDCSGTCGGTAAKDNCNTCDENPANNCSKDCSSQEADCNGTWLAGTSEGCWGGTALVDCTGSCVALASAAADEDNDGYCDDVDACPGSPANTQVNSSGCTQVQLSISQLGNAIPGTFAIAQNFPNPFNPTTSIAFDVAYMDNISLVVYDLTGKEVVTLASGAYAPGSYNVEWNAIDNKGQGLVSGMYIYRYTTSEKAITRKMLYLK
tara:strand:+ start:29 stop:1597 length:1569 start_codon:yes stop_codon:yes gene_type:complete